MTNEMKVIIIVGTFLLLFVNLTRIIWKETDNGTSEKQEIACLKGGGEVISDGVGSYYDCKLPDKVKI